MGRARFAVLPVILGILLAGCNRPSNTKLQQQFNDHRGELDELVAMSKQDPDFVRITPVSVVSKEFVQYPDQSGNTGLPSDRWGEYQQLFHDAMLQYGLERYASGDVYLISARTGKEGHTVTWGYLHCAHAPAVSGDEAPPCRSTQPTLSQPATGPGTQPFFYQQLADRWFLYKQGTDH